jgi:hypothetical protein
LLPEVEEGLLRFLAETESDARAFIARKHHWLLGLGHRSVSNALVFRAEQPLLIMHEDRPA